MYISVWLHEIIQKKLTILTLPRYPTGLWDAEVTISMPYIQWFRKYTLMMTWVGLV